MAFNKVKLCLVVALAISATSAEKCKPSTCFSSNKSPIFSSQTGQQLTYDFESTATAQLINKESVETSVSVKGKAVIVAKENCGYSLSLEGVTATGADGNKLSIQKDVELPIEFTLSGDELSSDICADSADGIFSLNIKRGVISALQNAVGRSFELDIFGKCPISASSSTSGGVTTVVSSRDLNQCAYREKLLNGFVQGVVSESSEIKSSPILDGKVESNAKFENGALKSIELKEFYNFLPFSTETHGAKGKVLTKMDLKNSATGNGKVIKTPVLRTLLFENTNSLMVNPKAKIFDSIKSAFHKTLQEFTAQEGVLTSKAATSFADLVRLMRLAKRADLVRAYNEMKKGSLSDLSKTASMKAISRSVFLDALFRAGTGDSVAALADFAKKELNEKEQQLMYLSFNLVQSVNKDAITGLTKLFTDKLPKEGYLSIGSVVNKYCKDRGCEPNDVKAIADKFIAKIPKDCKTKGKVEEDQLVAVLKGIRNSQTILNSALDKIIQCAGNKNPNRIRVAALQSYTANSCNKKLQQSAQSLMKDRQEDSEIRIEAYLSAMDCPSGGLANEVKALLDTEPINQVGTFVNSHLDSIKASTDPKREAARAHFRNVRTSKKFPFDPRRYSFNREVSYAIDSLGVGEAVDTSVIYSQQSFLPRSVRVNMTGNFFGSSFNMLEVSARQENLEQLVEHYFGPRGLFSSKSNQELYDALTKEFKSLSRNKRALPADLQAFDKGVKLSSEYGREPDLDLSMKVFGSELYFLSLSQNVPATPTDFIKMVAQELNKGVDALKDFKYNFENHALWMDSEIVYPTALGLPFKLTGTGASAVKVDFAGSVDVKKILEDPFNSKMYMQFSPAANIYISGSMGFSAYAFDTALEVTGSFYTNTGANTTVEIVGGQSVVVSTVPTVKQQYIIDMTHEVSKVTQEIGKEAVKTAIKPKTVTERDSEMCFDQVEFLTGFTFCTKVVYFPLNATNNALWPLHGNDQVTVKLEMVDAITFRAELDNSEPGKPGVNFYYDTPFDGKPRQTSLKLLSSLVPEHFMAGFDLKVPVDVESPINVNAGAGLVNQQNEKKLYLSGNYMGSVFEYALGFSRKGNEIVPILKFNSDLKYMDGKILEEKTANGVKYTLKQVKFGQGGNVLTADGSIEVDGSKINADMKFTQEGKNYNVQGTLGYQPGQIDTDFKLSSPQVPTANGKLNYNLRFSEKNLGNDLIVVWDKDANSKKNRFELSQNSDWSNKELFVTKNSFSFGKYNFAGKFDGEFGKKILNLDSFVDYNNQKAELKIDNKYSQRQPHDYETSIYASANQKSAKLDMKRDIEGDSSKVTNKFELSNGIRAELNGKIGHKFDCKNADISVQGIFVPGPKKEQTKATIFFKNTDKGHQSNSKVTVGKKEIANIETDLTFGNKMDGKLKASFNDVIKMDGTFTSNDGTGNAVVNADVKDRKLRAESQFTVKKPTYDFVTDIFYDYEKDNAKKVHFSTKNQLQDKSISSKNDVEVFNERYTFNIDASTEGAYPQGKQKLVTDFTLPTGRKFILDAAREINSAGDSVNGQVHWTATDELPSKQQRQVVFDMKLKDVNRRLGFFDQTSTLKYRGFDNKDFKIQGALKNLKKGHFSTAAGSLQVDGTLVAEPVTVNIMVDEYCENHAIYTANGKYGSVGDVDINGKFYTATKDRPHSHDFTGVLNLPNTKLQRVTVTSNGQFTEPSEPEGNFIVKYSGAVDVAGKKVQFDTDMKVSEQKGSGSAKLHLPDVNPISGEVSYSCNGNDKGDASLTVNYGNNKKVQTTLSVQHGDNNVNVNAALKGDFEVFKDLSVQLNAKQPTEDEIISKTVVSLDGKQYSCDYEHRASTKEPKFHVIVVHPQGTSKIMADAVFVSQLKGKGSILIENIESFDLTAKLDGDLTALENFYLNGEVDSPKLGVKQFVFDVKAKDAGAGKTGVEFKATVEGKHLISGTTDFTTKTDKDKTIIEGKSTVKLTEGKGDEITFKLVRNIFERSRDGESGFGGSLGVFVGQRNYASELKVTDKEFNAKYSGCEGKTKCTKLSMRSALQKPTIEGFSHTFDFVVDMRPIGFSHEFGIKSDTNRDGFKFRHTFETYLKAAKDKPEYMYSFFIDPKRITSQLDIPSRQVSLEGSYKYPEKSPYGVYDGTLAFYLDKTHKPQQKSEVSFSGELKQNKGVMTGKGNVYFSHPTIKKLRVGGEFSSNIDAMDTSSKLEFDVFNNPADMIVIVTKLENSDTSGYGFNITGDVEVNSKGLGINAKYHEHAGLSFEKRLISFGNELVLPVKDFKFGYDFNLDQDNSEFIVTAFAVPIVSSSAKYDFGKYDMETECKVQWPGSVPLVQKSTVSGLTKGNFMLNKGKQFEVDSGYELGKDMHLVVKGSGKEIFNGKVLLDANHFMKSNYHIDEPELKAFGTQLKDQFKTDFNNAEKDVKDKFTSAKTFLNEKCEKMSKAVPNFSQLQKECSDEFEKFVQELKKDEAIKKLIDQFIMVIEEISKVFETFSSYVKQQFETIDKAVRDFYTQAVATFNEKILPEIEKFYESLKTLALQIYEQTAKILTAAFERIAKAMKTFEEDFNKISKAINEATSSTYEAISQYMSELIKEMKDLCESFKKQLQELPGVGYIKEKYNEILGEFHPVETLKAILAEVFDTLVSVLPPKAEPLFTKLSDYINKKLSDEKVDDVAVLKDIYSALLEALSGVKKEYIDGFSLWSMPSNVNIDVFKRLPPFISNIRFSAFNQLTSEPIINLRDLVYLYRPYAFNPIEFVPPFKLHGEVSDGSHIFTFDGRHLTFPGKCSYILSRDFLNGNFSIVATLDNGKMKSIALTDKEGSLEITKDGVLTASDKKTEFPYHQKTIHAWRKYYTVAMATEYGAMVQCSHDLVTCHFTVSGFYSGKLRGLLGNGNNEPYDDYLLPTGKITESTSEFGNAYRTKKSCEAVATTGDDHPKSHSNQYCTQYFGHDSPMRLCYLFVNPANYREACEHGTHGAKNDQQSACAIASTYASRCRQEFIPVDIPKSCVSCKVGDQVVEVGDVVSVKVPKKQADIVIAFDGKLGAQKTLVQEVVTELKAELKKQGIDDVRVSAVGFSADDKYIYQYTTNGKLEFTGNFTELETSGPKEEAPLKTGHTDVDSALETLEASNRNVAIDLGLSADAKTFRYTLDYPFRATASKVIIAFRSDGVPYSANPGKLVMSEAVAKLVYERGIYLAAFMPIKIVEPADKAKNIVGFNNNVALLMNEKKRPNMGSVDIARKLQFEADMGADVTRKYGYVFNLNNYATDNKKFVGVAAYTLADVISRTEIQSDCKCTIKSGLYAQIRCQANEQKLLSPKKDGKKK